MLCGSSLLIVLILRLTLLHLLPSRISTPFIKHQPCIFHKRAKILQSSLNSYNTITAVLSKTFSTLQKISSPLKLPFFFIYRRPMVFPFFSCLAYHLCSVTWFVEIAVQTARIHHLNLTSTVRLPSRGFASSHLSLPIYDVLSYFDHISIPILPSKVYPVKPGNLQKPWFTAFWRTSPFF